MRTECRAGLLLILAALFFLPGLSQGPLVAQIDDGFELPAPEPGFTGERWAVVIGISEYEDPEIDDLNYAHRDAQAFYSFITSPAAGAGGVPRANARLLTNQQADFQTMRTVLYDFLQRPEPGDQVFFFFAGHGLTDRQGRSTPYIIPHDGQRNSLAAWSVRTDEIERALLDTQANVVMFLDACHAAAVDGGRLTRGAGGNRINTEFLARLAEGDNDIQAIVASGPDQLAEEGEEWGGGHGVFTYHLIQGLGGLADVNENSIIELGELADYVRVRVARDTNNRQIPEAGIVDPNVPLAITGEAVTAAMPRTQPDQPVTNIMTNDPMLGLDLLNDRWFGPDSIVTFMGMADTVRLRLDSHEGRVIPPTRLSWFSSSPSVVDVDDFGVLHPQDEGYSTITATFGTKDQEIIVNVLPTPRRIRFSHEGEEVTVTQHDEFRIAAVVELPDGRTVTGLLPNLSLPDSSVIAYRGNGQFRALRPGTARTRASLGSESREWLIRVLPPSLAIRSAGYQAFRLGETIPIEASYVRPDGTPLQETLRVSWTSSDTTVVQPTADGLQARGLGRTVIEASAGGSTDSLTVFVLGDLLLVREGESAPIISTMSLATGEVIDLLDDEFGATEAALSPDGRSIAFVSAREPAHPRIYLMDSDGSNIRRLTAERSGIFGLPIPLYQEHGPAWSSDGSRVFFIGNNTGNYEIYATDVLDGTVERITRSGSLERHPSLFPGEGRVAFERVSSAFDSDIWLALEDGSEAVNLTGDRSSSSGRGTFRESAPTLLPGNRMLYLEGADHASGDALALFDLGARQRSGELVRRGDGQEIVYAVSPLGDRVAYTQRSRLGGNDEVLVIVDLEGVPTQTFELPFEGRILDLSWGAVSPHMRLAEDGDES